MQMRVARGLFICLAFFGTSSLGRAQQSPSTTSTRRNVIIFVADGLRAGSVNQKDAPTLWAIRQHGVNFVNSHSLFPTFTTANASAIATGHGLGDTGDFSNTIWTGFATFDTGDFGLGAGTPVPFIEKDRILADLDEHYQGNYLHEMTLLTAAANGGYNIASVGKVGPVAIQQVESIRPIEEKFPNVMANVLLDDGTGTAAAPPLPATIAQGLLDAGMSPEAPNRTNGYGATAAWNNGNAGNPRQPGTRFPNVVQQEWFADVTTKVILPAFQRDAPKPFLLLYWSRDPDGTQHNQGDSLGTFFPGINGDSSRLAVQNADRNLRQILDWLDANPAVKAQTDVFVTSDHGFATISRKEINRTGRSSESESAKHYYYDAAGNVETDLGALPNGFLAIDLAVGLHTNLFDPDRFTPEGVRGPFRQVRLRLDSFEHPADGGGLLGLDVRKPDGSDATAIVAANGGSDLIYVPDHNPDTVHQIVDLLTGFDYVGGIFVDDQFGKIPGTLPLSSIGLVGASPLPRPAIVVAFRVFYYNPKDLQTAVQVADTGLQEGQGMHGGIGRESTFNNMAAIGPDFKSGFVDEAPIGNADIVPTIAHILGIAMPANGKLKGRVLEEALVGGNDKVPVTSDHVISPAANGKRTILYVQKVGEEQYVDKGCFLSVEEGDECP